MTPFTWASRLVRTPEIVLPIRSYIGIQERREEIDRTEMRRSLNGTAVPLRPLYGTLYRLSLSASGPATRWTPAFSHLTKTGVYRIASTQHLDGQIRRGETRCLLTRDPVPGTVRAFRADDLDETQLLLNVDGRVVTLSAPAPADVYVAYLPFHDCILTDRGSSAGEIEGSKEWTMVFEENAP